MCKLQAKNCIKMFSFSASRGFTSLIALVTSIGCKTPCESHSLEFFAQWFEMLLALYLVWGESQDTHLAGFQKQLGHVIQYYGAYDT